MKSNFNFQFSIFNSQFSILNSQLKKFTTLALALTATLNAQNTVYIVAAPSEANQFSWAQLNDAVDALGATECTLDISGATPDATQRTVALGAKSVTLKGDAAKTYPLNVTTSANLTLVDFKSSVTGAVIALTASATTTTLTVTGDCSLVSAGGHGIQSGSLTVNFFSVRQKNFSNSIKSYTFAKI